MLMVVKMITTPNTYYPIRQIRIKQLPRSLCTLLVTITITFGIAAQTHPVSALLERDDNESVTVLSIGDSVTEGYLNGIVN
jgi:hypothetical protein